MHEALPAVGHEARLGCTRRAARRSTRRPAEVEQLHARLDHRAVDDAGGDRRHLAGRHRHHGLVEQGEAPGEVAEGDGRLPCAEKSEREQILVAAACCDLDDAVGDGAYLLDVARPSSSRKVGTSRKPEVEHSPANEATGARIGRTTRRPWLCALAASG